MLKMTAAELTLSSAQSQLLLLLLLVGTVLVMPAAAAEWDRSSPGRAEAGSPRHASSSSSSSSPVDGGSGLRFGDFHGAGKEDSSNLSFTHSSLRRSLTSHTGLRYQINYLPNFSELPKMHSKSFICPS